VESAAAHSVDERACGLLIVLCGGECRMPVVVCLLGTCCRRLTKRQGVWGA